MFLQNPFSTNSNGFIFWIFFQGARVHSISFESPELMLQDNPRAFLSHAILTHHSFATTWAARIHSISFENPSNLLCLCSTYVHTSVWSQSHTTVRDHPLMTSLFSRGERVHKIVTFSDVWGEGRGELQKGTSPKINWISNHSYLSLYQILKKCVLSKSIT